MDKVIYIIKIFSIIQVSLIAIFIVLAYFTKMMIDWQNRKKQKRKENISRLLHEAFKKNEPLGNSPNVVIELRKSVDLLLPTLDAFEKQQEPSEHLNRFIREISELVLQPAARKLAFSRLWFKRYLAVLCFAYGYQVEDRTILIKLIRDDVVLVATNAARISVKYVDAELINEMITVFSHGRRLQQSTYAELLTEGSADIFSIIENRLLVEKNLYVKIFCFRILNNLPWHKEILTYIRNNLNTDSADLKIAMMGYIANSNDPDKIEIIEHLSNDSQWEVQAVAAKMLANIDTPKSLDLLTAMLTSPEWWVRINAAHALGRKGESGLAILQGQSMEKDKFAYETANEVLKQLEIYRE